MLPGCDKLSQPPYGDKMPRTRAGGRFASLPSGKCSVGSTQAKQSDGDRLSDLWCTFRDMESKYRQFALPLPKTLDSKQFHYGVIGDKCGSLDEGLRREYPVERIAMLDSVPACRERMMV